MKNVTIPFADWVLVYVLDVGGGGRLLEIGHQWTEGSHGGYLTNIYIYMSPHGSQTSKEPVSDS
jgi:hypothetical protein